MTHFGATQMNEQIALRAFQEHRAEIEEIAEKKILAGSYERGDEVSLRMGDFTRRSTPTTTTQGPRFRNLDARISQEILDDPFLLSGVREANLLLEEDLVREGMPVSAEWDLVPTPTSLQLARLHLTDSTTDAAVEGLFTGKDLANVPFARFSLFRLWDDLLREKGRKQMLQFADSSGA